MQTYVLEATIKDRYMNLTCSVEAAQPQEAVERLKRFLQEVQMYHTGEVVVNVVPTDYAPEGEG
jgi:thioester reductase-like protein